MSEVVRALGLLELRLTRIDSAQMSARALKRVALAAALLLPRPRGNEVCCCTRTHSPYKCILYTCPLQVVVLDEALAGFDAGTRAGVKYLLQIVRSEQKF